MPHSFSQILLQSPQFVAKASPFSNISNGSKSSGNTHAILLPKLSLLASNPSVQNIMSYPKDLSSLIQKKGFSLVENCNSNIPIKEKKQEIIHFDEKTSRLQVQSFLNSIKALPIIDKAQILNLLRKDGDFFSISVFNDMLMALVIINELDLALSLYSDLSSFGLVSDYWTFSILIRCYGKRNDVDEAKKVLDYMLDNGLKPNVVTFTAVIDSCCKKGKMQSAYEVFEVMGKSGCRPNVKTYNCLLKGLCHVGRVEDAFRLLDDIKKSSPQPDIYTYTVMMDGFCKVGRSNEAMELLNEAIEMGLTPTVVTFNTLFDGYKREGRPLEGLNVIKKMKTMNVLPDSISYSTLLHGLLVWKKVRGALRVYGEMVSNGFEVDHKLMNSLVRGLCRKFLKDNELLEEAYQVFENMKERACVIDHRTYSMVIQALLMAKKVDDALSSLHQMIASGYKPRLITLVSVLRAFCIEGKIEKAISMLVLMFEVGKIPGVKSYDLIIRELNGQRRFTVACNVYGAALVRGVIPNQKPG